MSEPASAIRVAPPGRGGAPRATRGVRTGVHLAFLLCLVFAFTLSCALIGLRGCSYYLSSQEERPFHQMYDALKPSGAQGHGYGIVGTALIVAGVALYSTRKRVRRVSQWGRISYWLEFHIFLCLTGPMLVLYHTTFKFGGLVAVSFWSMAAVVLSGIAGRYLYVQIPRGIHGNELSAAELARENEALQASLQQLHGVRPELLKAIDALALPSESPTTMPWHRILRTFLMDDLSRRLRLRRLLAGIAQSADAATAARLRRLARRRIVLSRRIAFLERFREMFQYWHVVHLPFSIVMFVILLIHVAVAVLFGYTWIL